MKNCISESFVQLYKAIGEWAFPSKIDSRSLSLKKVCNTQHVVYFIFWKYFEMFDS